ncbi:MAG TPA: alpha/beta hydrolase [Candidatus Limnocylindrales bacterium]|nr:alpha/beta hydrolase [Candidatus Limnocylindrales bacterium]
MPYELPPDPSTERRTRITRWASFAFAAVLVALVAYLGYVGYEGSRQLTDPPAPSADCRTPASLGWAYEAINYDIAPDAELAAEADPASCTRRGADAGDAVSVGEVGLAGWYVPAGNGAGPTGPTIVLAHGWGSNKSNMLGRAGILHDAFNLLLFDFRNHGQSSGSATTQGIREANDLRAMIDWLERDKGPEAIVVLGDSMGGATALAEADQDPRVDAVIAESTHATLANAAQARLDRSNYPLSMPGSWAILLGTLIRTGEDVSAVDPIETVERLDDRPLLLIHAGRDTSIGPDDAETMLAAAEAAGSPAELDICADAGHSESYETCPEDYAGWVLGFLERVLAPAS